MVDLICTTLFLNMWDIARKLVLISKDGWLILIFWPHNSKWTNPCLNHINIWHSKATDWENKWNHASMQRGWTLLTQLWDASCLLMKSFLCRLVSIRLFFHITQLTFHKVYWDSSMVIVIPLLNIVERRLRRRCGYRLCCVVF